MTPDGGPGDRLPREDWRGLSRSQWTLLASGRWQWQDWATLHGALNRQVQTRSGFNAGFVSVYVRKVSSFGDIITICKGVCNVGLRSTMR